jgi:hypothetical protein
VAVVVAVVVVVVVVVWVGIELEGVRWEGRCWVICCGCESLLVGRRRKEEGGWGEIVAEDFGGGTGVVGTGVVGTGAFSSDERPGVCEDEEIAGRLV